MTSEDRNRALDMAAVPAGLFATLFLSSILNSSLGAYDPHWNSAEEGPKPDILVALLTIASLAAFVAGYIAASIARHRLRAAAIVAGLIALLELTRAVYGHNENPLWYSVLSVLLPAILIIFAAWLQSKFPLTSRNH